MKKYFFSILLIPFLLAACNTGQADKEKAVRLDIANLDSLAPALVGKLVSVDGTVMHVCRESGKRFFLGEENFKVLASDKIARFDVSLEGSDVVASGILKEDRITKQYLDSWEQELQTTASVPLKEAIHTGEGGHDDAAESATETQLKQIKNYRDQIAADPKGYLSFYSLEISDLKEVR
jgi:hypothetical protein